MRKYVKDEKIMENERRIKGFNRENRPFYIVDHDDGTFSLCLPIDLFNGQYADYCQTAFDNYIRIAPNDIKLLLSGEMNTVVIDGCHYAAFELLDQEVVGMQTDIFDDNLIRMKTGGYEEPDFEMTI